MKINIAEIEDDISGNWWNYINSENFGFLSSISDQSNFEVSVNDILIHKEIEEGSNFPTIRYHIIKKDGTEIVDKKGLYEVLIPKLIKYVQKNKKLPWKCQVFKFFANGSAQINYQPTNFDKFVLKVSPKEHGIKSTKELFDGLQSSENPIKEIPSAETKETGKQWKIPSSSDPNKVYVVTLTGSGNWTCTCPQFTYRKKQCKHIIDAKKNI